MNRLYSIAQILKGLEIIFFPVLASFFLLTWFFQSKTFKRIFSPCQECHFKPAVATQQHHDGSWHQIQECERCGRKRDAVLRPDALEAAQRFFYGKGDSQYNAPTDKP